MINTRGRVFTNHGNPIKQLYRARYDDAGAVALVDDGQEDLYAYIQSHADSVDVHVMLKRFANGDKDALSKRQGIYADVTGMPRTYAELLNTVNDLERRFMELPPDIREKFGNSFSQYAAQLGTPAYMAALGITDVKPDVVESDAAVAKEVDINE